MRAGFILAFCVLLGVTLLASVINQEEYSTDVTIKETIKAKPGATGVNAVVNEDGSVTLIYSVPDLK